MKATDYAKTLLDLDPDLDADLVVRAHERSARVHDGQLRKSGDPFLTHGEAVGTILAGLRLDTSTVAAGLLHDVVEDGDVQVSELAAEFGPEIASLVDGVTKITGLRFESQERRQAENFRKMLLSVVKDVRVILIKLADRLHNMRTISHLTSSQIERISRETREIYAPLAGRFGMARIQRELEDLAFRWLEPDDYRELVERISSTRAERQAFIDDVSRPVRERLDHEGIDASIAGRAKHAYSIYRKMMTRGKSFEEIYDLLAVRVITDSVGECYRILGIVHTLYTPVHDRIKDYIATPKLNGYQSLHTTVVGPRGQMVEIQIRTNEMHETAEFGIAAHWSYKEGRPAEAEVTRQLGWVRQLLEGNVDIADADEFLESLKVDLYRDEIFVFTPRGDLKQLPRGATPIDFAYAIHTDVGDHCAGARVNGKMVSLRQALSSGDTVEIMTSDAARPSRDWLGIVTTSRAKSKIRHYLRAQADGESVVLGRRIIEREMKRLGDRAKNTSIDDIAQSFGLDGTEELASAVGKGEIGVGELARHLSPREQGPRALVERITRRVRRHDAGVRIEGIGDIMVRFAKCCEPVPGDRIVGIITRGRGVSVHRVGCANAFGPTIDDEHRIAVDWDVAEGQTFPASFTVFGDLKRGFLADVSKVIADEGVTLSAASMSSEDGQAVVRFRVEVGNLHRLRRLMKAIEALRKVKKVLRARPGSER